MHVHVSGHQYHIIDFSVTFLTYNLFYDNNRLLRVCGHEIQKRMDYIDRSYKCITRTHVSHSVKWLGHGCHTQSPEIAPLKQSL